MTIEEFRSWALRIAEKHLNMSLSKYILPQEQHDKTPSRFIMAINNHYDTKHRLYDIYAFDELLRLGEPLNEVNYLRDTFTPGSDERSIVIAFLHAISKTDVGKQLANLPRRIINREFENNDTAHNIMPLLSRYDNSEPDSWGRNWRSFSKS